MTSSVLQEAQTSDGTGTALSSLAVTLTGITAGSYIHVLTVCGGASTTTFTDSNADTPAVLDTYLDSPHTGAQMTHGVFGPVAAGSITFTAHYATAEGFCQIWAREIGGCSGVQTHTIAGATSAGVTPTAAPALWSGLGFITDLSATPAATSGTQDVSGWDYSPTGFPNLATSSHARVTSTSAVTASYSGGTQMVSYIAVFTEASSGITLGSQTVTSSEGTIARAVTYALSGQTATFTEGTITASTGGNVTRSLTAQTATFVEGLLAVNIGYVLTDGVPLTGQTATFAEGSPNPNVAYTLGSQTATFAEGTIAPSAGGNVTKSLAGQIATFSLGTITASISYPVVGQTATFAEGIVAPGVTATLVGQSITSALGALSRAVSYALSGQTVTFTEGVITASVPGSVTVQIGSLSAAFTLGTITATVTGSGIVMPNLIGLNYYEALLALQLAGIYLPLPAYAFAPSSISVKWLKTNLRGGIVAAQSLSAGLSATPGQAITLTVSAFVFGSTIDSIPDWNQLQ